MKVSIRTGMRAGDPVNPLDGALKDVKALGYDGIELQMSPRHFFEATVPWGGQGLWLSEDVTAGQRASIRESSRAHGIEIATLSADWAWAYAQVCPKLSQWDRGVEILRSDVDLIADVGGKAMLMHVGESNGSWAEIRSIVERVVEQGAKRDVRIGFEAGIFARTGLGGLPELIKLVDEIKSPHFGIYEHCYWPRGDLQPHEEIAMVGNRMVCLHSFLPAVQVDYARMFAALRDVSYDWYWVYEVPWEQAAPAIAAFRHLEGAHSRE